MKCSKYRLEVDLEYYTTGRQYNGDHLNDESSALLSIKIYIVSRALEKNMDCGSFVIFA